MAILNNISVGDVQFYEVDDIPDFSAPKGSIAILNEGKYVNSMTWINNDGGPTWVKIINPAYGEIILTNGTTGVVFANTGGNPLQLGFWNSFNPIDTWVLGDVDKYGLEASRTDSIEYTGDTLTRCFTSFDCTIRGGTGKWVSLEVGVSLNFSEPVRWQEGFTQDNSATASFSSSHILELAPGNFILGALSPISRESGGGATARTAIPKHGQVTSTKIDEALKKIDISEDFESSGFTENGWTVVNDTTNVWTVGTAQNNTSGGSYGAYISNDGGINATYTNTVANVSHFYKDFIISSNVDEVFLEFDWKCGGENAAGATQYDYGCVVITDTGTTPTAGVEVSITTGGGGTDGRYGATPNSGKFNLGYGTTPGTTWNTESIDLSAYAGQTKRIVFTWKNDGSIGANPPFTLDNIKLVEYTW